MNNKKIVQQYLNKYFKNQYIKENDQEFKSFVQILNKKDKEQNLLVIELLVICYKSLCTYGSHPLIEKQFKQVNKKIGIINISKDIKLSNEIDNAIKEDDIIDLRSKLGLIYTEYIQKLQEENKSVIK